MKTWPWLILTLLLFSCGSSNSSTSAEIERIFIDENSKVIPMEMFLERWRDENQGLTRWDYIQDNKRIAQLFRPVYKSFLTSYPDLHDQLENSTGKQFDENTVFLIKYRFKDDLCTSSLESNQWNEERIQDRKKILDSPKQKVEKNHSNLVYLYFFEEGISLSNQPKSNEEYFFTDKNNSLRRSIFKIPALCGSFALVKPNGQVVIRQGEYSATAMAAFLTSEKWRNFSFTQKN